MIQYSLRCAQDHKFDSWFQSADAYDKLRARDLVSCAICGTTDVHKAIMAPAVTASRKKAAEPQPDTNEQARPLSAPKSPAEQALAELKKHVEQNADYVGKDFAKIARAQHEGTAPERAIYGEARVDEAKKLFDDGIPVAPLPFTPARKTN